MTDLLARLEVAEAGSRELDQVIACRFPETLRIRDVEQCSEFHPSRTGMVMYCREGQAGYSTSAADVQHFTTCVTAALALASRVLPGWCWEIRTDIEGATVQAAPAWWTEGLAAPDRDGVATEAPTPALALCAAILRAKGAEQ